jgi:4-hydroxy-tetrahydrodipicolinate synthase
MFEGSSVAIVTPFREGKVDYDAFKELVNWQIEEGIDCIVPCGSTGESATLTHDEHRDVVSFVINEVAGRVKVMPGTGSNSTWEAVELTESAKADGADGALVITPYYNKPTQEGLYQHYKKIAERVDIPICLYNVPGRTGVNMERDTVKRLAEIENIVAIKEASGKVSQSAEIIRLCGDKIAVISGDDALTYPLMAIGGKGVISVVANLVPSVVKDMTSLMLNGKSQEALSLHYKWLPLMDAMFVETNPAPVKEALAMMGKISPELRLPLVNMKESNKDFLKNVMKDMGLQVKS